MSEFIECDSCKAKAQKQKRARDKETMPWRKTPFYVVELCDDCVRRRLENAPDAMAPLELEDDDDE